jgi:hypothetical protein
MHMLIVKVSYQYGADAPSTHIYITIKLLRDVDQAYSSRTARADILLMSMLVI